MNQLKKAGGFVRNCVELYIPVISFAVLFLVFCYQIFMRRVLNNPQTWTLEVEQMCFLWVVLLGACFAQRQKAHVTFTLLYDSLKVRGKAITALMGNLIIAVTFTLAAIPSFLYIIEQVERQQMTSILKISKAIVFFPYIIFMVFILVYTIMDIYEEIMVLRGSEYHTKRMLNSGKSEAQIAIEESLAQEQIDLTKVFAEEPAKPKKEKPTEKEES
ncbi:MAG: TRAP transporter small permease [Pseudoflavonifractor sp.]